MCVKFEVLLPTVNKFLLIYSLRWGCIVIHIWTMFRTLFCVCFFALATLEVLIKQKLPFGALLPKTSEEQISRDVTKTLLRSAALSGNQIVIIYFLYLGLVVAEMFLFAYSFYLARGLCLYTASPIAQYLLCRVATWFVEVLCLVILCLQHETLIGFYLGFLFFVILELYSWVVVYSYYCELDDQEKEGNEDNKSDEP